MMKTVKMMWLHFNYYNSQSNHCHSSSKLYDSVIILRFIPLSPIH